MRMDVLHPDAGFCLDLFHIDFPSYEMLHIAAEGHRLHQQLEQTFSSWEEEANGY